MNAAQLELIFQRLKLRCSQSEAFYDPYSYTLHDPQNYLNKEIHLSSSFHELAHWIQQIDYTFGGFLTSIMHLRDDYAVFILKKGASSINDDDFKLISPYIPTDDRFFYDYFGNEVLEESVIEYQFAWRDTLLTEKYFLHLSDFSSRDRPINDFLLPEQVIARTLIRVANWGADNLLYTEHYNRIEVNDDALPKIRNFSEVKINGEPLDTIDIMESIAVALEIKLLADQNKIMAASNRLTQLIASRYTKALRVFSSILGLDLSSNVIESICFRFLVVAELSLQAPLPPFGIAGSLEFDWKKIYPPHRFIDICNTAKSTPGYIIADNSIEWLPEWADDLIRRHLEKGGIFSRLDRNKDGYLPSEISLPFLHMVANEDITMREILKSKGVYDKKWEEKAEEVIQHSSGLVIYAMLRHGHILSMNWHDTIWAWELPWTGNGNEWGRRFVPPILALKNGELIAGGWSEKFGELLVARNFSTYPLQSLLLNEIKPKQYLQGIVNKDFERVQEVKLKELISFLKS